jgi:hypothetical protein
MMKLNQEKLDAAESAFFARQLEFVYTRTYDIKYADLKARRYIPGAPGANPGATTVTYEQFEEVGQARVGSHSSDKPPRVDVNGNEFTRPVREVEASYGWHVKEVKSAAMAGNNLNARRAAACRRAIERKLDEISAIGSPLHGIATGALNEAASTIDASAGSWTAPATADTIIGEIGDMWKGIIDDTLEVETADTLLLPGQEWAHIAITPRSTTSDTTILEFVRKSFPDLTTIEPWHRLATAGAGSVRRGMMYRRSDEILANEITLDFEQLPVQPDGMQFVVNCMASTAGVAVYYPLAVRYLDGI